MFSNVCNCITLTTGEQRELPTEHINPRGHVSSMMLLEAQIAAYEGLLKTHTPSFEGWQPKEKHKYTT